MIVSVLAWKFQQSRLLLFPFSSIPLSQGRAADCKQSDFTVCFNSNFSSSSSSSLPHLLFPISHSCSFSSYSSYIFSTFNSVLFLSQFDFDNFFKFFCIAKVGCRAITARKTPPLKCSIRGPLLLPRSYLPSKCGTIFLELSY